MRKTTQMTLAALAVSIALTGCKSSQGPSVVVKGGEKQITTVTPQSQKTQTTASTKPVETNPVPTTKPVSTPKPKETAKPANTTKPAETTVKPAETTNTVTDVKPQEPPRPTVKAINTDSSGKLWRVIPLSTTSGFNDGSSERRENREHFVLPEDEEDRSPFNASEDEKFHNYLLALDLGTNNKNTARIPSLQKAGSDYLGMHSGTYQDDKLEGEVLNIDRNGEVSGSKANTVQYLYVNQPYSSYGTIFTNANDVNLFNVRLSTGRDGRKASSEGLGSRYAEYGVFSLNNGVAKWNDGLTGDATYKGSVIARVERSVDGNSVAEAPRLDGDVTLTLHLNNDWEKNRLSGQINSSTVGTIQLNESSLPDARFLRDRVGFNGESQTQSGDLSGYYSTELVGEKLYDAVGTIDLESDSPAENGVSKYNAVFGGTKQ